MHPVSATSVFALENLHCADCAAKLEKAVRELEGVETAQVNIIASKITVRHRGNEGPIRALLARQGYLAKRDRTNFWLQPRTLSTLGAALLILSAVLSPQPVKTWLLVAATGLGAWFPALSGIKNLLGSRTFDINFLMTIAVIGALAIGELGEAATVVLLFAFSHSLEAFTMGRTRRSVHNLMELAPDTAWIEEGEDLIAVPTASLQPGQQIVVKPGERIPVDGEILAGVSEVNQAQITGESMPMSRGPGDAVYAGSVNGSGQIRVVASKAAADSSLARIVAMVEEAATSRPPVQQFVDSFARWYTPLVIALAIGITVLPPLFLHQAWQPWLYRGLALLVVACPCALVISTPVSIVSALGNAARRGVLIKNGAALERTAAISIIAMDKTGTLTRGEPRLVAIHPAGGHSETEVLRLAASVEQGSSHPLAAAVIAAARDRQLKPAAGMEYKTLPGHGAMATIDGTNVYAVSPTFAQRELGLSPRLAASGKTQVILAKDCKELAHLEFQDTLRPGAREIIRQLKALSANPVMLTGDSQGVAAEIAREAGIADFHAHLLPQEKLSKIKDLRSQGATMMVGDGINDAPALAAADVGVAMGAAGSDTALESADIALMADDLSQLPFLLRLSRRALATIRFNIWFAVAVKLLAVALVFPGWLTLWLAIMADTGATVLVTLNGMRLLKLK